MENFTPVSALIGGAFIGLSAIIMLAGNGRIAGISGILGGAISSRGDERRGRILFLAGLLLATLLYQIVSSSPITIEAQASPELLVIAGLLVGFGTRLGSGCTSGHGILFSIKGCFSTNTFDCSSCLTLTIRCCHR